MINILEHLKKQVSLKHIKNAANCLLDMGLSTEEVASIIKIKRHSPRFDQSFDEFKAQIVEGDEIWYFEWRPEAFTGCGGYTLIRNGADIATLRTWVS